VRDDETYRRARRRVRARLGFYRHAATFAAVIGALFVIDWLTGGGWWVQWPAAFWAAVLVYHAFASFVFPQVWGREVEERMIEEELRKDQGGSDQ
jgi:2TM domain